MANWTQANVDAHRAKLDAARAKECADAFAPLASMGKPTAVEKAEVKAERILQEQCEGWLRWRHDGVSYWHGNAKNAQRLGSPRIGWYGHLRKPKGNDVLMPDIWVHGVDGRVLLVELKVRSEYQPGQREMIDRGMWVEVRTLDAFREVVIKWEKGKGGVYSLLENAPEVEAEADGRCARGARQRGRKPHLEAPCVGIRIPRH